MASVGFPRPIRWSRAWLDWGESTDPATSQSSARTGSPRPTSSSAATASGSALVADDGRGQRGRVRYSHDERYPSGKAKECRVDGHDWPSGLTVHHFINLKVGTKEVCRRCGTIREIAAT